MSPTVAAAKLPPGPDSPIVVQTLQQLLNPLPYLSRQRDQYGSIFTLRFLGMPPLIVISDPKIIQALFTTNPRQFDSGQGNRRFLESWVGSNSLLLLDGDRHSRQKRLLMPPFHGDRMLTYGKAIQTIAQQVLQELPYDQPFVAREMTQKISLKVILRTVFGLEAGDRFSQLERRLCSMVDSMTGSVWRSMAVFLKPLQQDWGAWSPWGKFLREQQAIDALIYAEIAERRQSARQGPGHGPGQTESALPESASSNNASSNNASSNNASSNNAPDDAAMGQQNDVLSLMMAARDEDGEAMTDEELRDELMTLLIAGHETTATAIAWALYWCHRQPEVLQQLRAELQAWSNNGADLASLTKQPYLDAVCSETLRIFPVTLFTFTRMPKQPLDLAGYHFPPGAMLLPSVYLTHRREDLYPQADQFKPERFLQQQFSPFEYLPFGGSNRRCIGMAFALYEMKIVLAELLTQASFELLETAPVKSVRRGVTMAPEGGIRMIRRPAA